MAVPRRSLLRLGKRWAVSGQGQQTAATGRLVVRDVADTAARLRIAGSVDWLSKL